MFIPREDFAYRVKSSNNSIIQSGLKDLISWTKMIFDKVLVQNCSFKFYIFHFHLLKLKITMATLPLLWRPILLRILRMEMLRSERLFRKALYAKQRSSIEQEKIQGAFVLNSENCKL